VLPSTYPAVEVHANSIEFKDDAHTLAGYGDGNASAEAQSTMKIVSEIERHRSIE
jgi:hypothetical protein